MNETSHIHDYGYVDGKRHITVVEGSAVDCDSIHCKDAAERELRKVESMIRDVIEELRNRRLR